MEWWRGGKTKLVSKAVLAISYNKNTHTVKWYSSNTVIGIGRSLRGHV